MKQKSTTEIALQLNNIVDSVLTQVQLQGFERAFITSSAIKQLKELLNDQYMSPIMALQGSKLGFKTDKDKNGGYPQEVVKNCLIEAVLLGAQPYGNMFNIIAGNTYLTKEGIGHILNNWKGLKYTVVCGVPKLQPDNKSAVIEARINWTINNQKNQEIIPISVRNDAYATVDSLTGKATRKARAWLLGAISGIEVVEGDVEDITYTEVKSTLNPQQLSKEKERERIIKHIEMSKTITELERCQKAIPDDDHDLLVRYDDKKRELNAIKN